MNFFKLFRPQLFMSLFWFFSWFSAKKTTLRRRSDHGHRPPPKQPKTAKNGQKPTFLFVQLCISSFEFFSSSFPSNFLKFSKIFKIFWKFLKVFWDFFPRNSQKFRWKFWPFGQFLKSAKIGQFFAIFHYVFSENRKKNCRVFFTSLLLKLWPPLFFLYTE